MCPVRTPHLESLVQPVEPHRLEVRAGGWSWGTRSGTSSLCDKSEEPPCSGSAARVGRAVRIHDPTAWARSGIPRRVHESAYRQTRRGERAPGVTSTPAVHAAKPKCASTTPRRRSPPPCLKDRKSVV